MSSSESELNDTQKVVPPEEILTAPPVLDEQGEAEENPQSSAIPWLVVAKNKRVNRSWEALVLPAPANARRCYEDLCTAPMVKKPGRVFPE